jgi:hypothetical protein
MVTHHPPRTPAIRDQSKDANVRQHRFGERARRPGVEPHLMIVSSDSEFSQEGIRNQVLDQAAVHLVKNIGA